MKYKTNWKALAGFVSVLTIMFAGMALYYHDWNVLFTGWAVLGFFIAGAYIKKWLEGPPTAIPMSLPCSCGECGQNNILMLESPDDGLLEMQIYNGSQSPSTQETISLTAEQVDILIGTLTALRKNF
jgi:hypothetical protein